MTEIVRFIHHLILRASLEAIAIAVLVVAACVALEWVCSREQR